MKKETLNFRTYGYIIQNLEENFTSIVGFKEGNLDNLTSLDIGIEVPNQEHDEAKEMVIKISNLEALVRLEKLLSKILTEKLDLLNKKSPQQ